MRPRAAAVSASGIPNMKKSLIALALGTLALGVAEFVMMGILPNVASDMGVPIPTAGYLVSAYAIGVCVGAPALVLARRHPLKNIILALVCIIMLGNLCAAIAPTFEFMMFSRFISGLPHGAYFGVGSIIAEKLAGRGMASRAVSTMIAGMTVANLLGVPLGTYLSSSVSWRIPFFVIGAFGCLVLYCIWKWVPQVESLPDTGFRGQFRFLKSPAPWLLIGATMFGNGSVFCWYSYITPLLTKVSGFQPGMITPLMVLAGAGMVAGNLISGRLSDRFMPARVASCVQLCISAVLLLIFFFAQVGWLSVALMCACTACLFALGSPQQVLLNRFSKGGELLGAASAQVAFNLGNALGAYAGASVLSAGFGYRYPALVGVPFSLMGFAFLAYFFVKYERPAYAGADAGAGV